MQNRPVARQMQATTDIGREQGIGGLRNGRQNRCAQSGGTVRIAQLMQTGTATAAGIR